MLAMSGADLNAKNKNDETPSGVYFTNSRCPFILQNNYNKKIINFIV